MSRKAYKERHLALLQEAQRIARIGSWERDIVHNTLWWSDECYRLFGLEPGTVEASYNLFLQVIHPEDRARVHAVNADSLARRVPHQVDFRVILPSGEIRHFQNRGQVFLDPHSGEPIRTSGTTQDITDIKKTEARLILADTIVANSPVGILTTDAQGRILSANPAFTTITGFPASEVLDGPVDFLLDHCPPEQKSALAHALATLGRWSGELPSLRKNGLSCVLGVDVLRIDESSSAHQLWLVSDISERKRAEARIHHLAHHDPLTGLPNRLSLLARLEQALPEARRYGWNLALLFIDLDRFKVINDTLGHLVGDQLLMEVAGRLAATVRETDTVARLGGDEFVVLLINVGEIANAASVAGKIIAALAEPIRVEGHELHTSPSIGISCYPADGGDAETIMRNADTAMYHAKAAGRNTYQFYAEDMNRAATERLTLERKLRQAIARGEFTLHYQPQFDLRRRVPCGVEALLRWQTEEDGPIAPARFIPVAEETGLITGIGTWVLREACRQLRAWLDAGLRPLRVAVNLSARQLKQRDLPEIVAQALADSGLPAELLELELTESAVMEKPQDAILQLNDLRRMGVTLAIDDFGTGYSSLAYLKLLPLDRLKIDRSFVADIEHDANDRAIAIGTIALAHSLGLCVIAEGVETRVQQEFLAEHDCDETQGYLLARPLPAAEAFAFLHALQNASGG